jgi:hypothetical protein
MKMAEDLIAQMDDAMQQSTLPHSPNLQKIDKLSIELVEMQGW